ncbi:heparinase II/III-family protein [Niabella hibiscisoli]|nr:heparinase II/III-family protein [Niabella hibiscisoli]
MLCKKKNYFFAAKGGFNNESHNHNDVGTFSLYVDTIPFFIDAGVGTYTRQTFGRERYSIWTMQSNYHSLPMINGEAQQFGAKYKSSNVSFSSGTKNLAWILVEPTIRKQR